MAMSDRWKDAVIYGIDYLSRLGVTCAPAAF